MVSKDGERLYLQLLTGLQLRRSTAEVALILAALLSMERFRLPSGPEDSPTASSSCIAGMDLIFKGFSSSKRLSVFEQLATSLMRVLQTERFQGDGESQDALQRLALALGRSPAVLGFLDGFFDQSWMRWITSQLSCSQAYTDTLKDLDFALISMDSTLTHYGTDIEIKTETTSGDSRSVMTKSHTLAAKIQKKPYRPRWNKHWLCFLRWC